MYSYKLDSNTKLKKKPFLLSDKEDERNDYRNFVNNQNYNNSIDFFKNYVKSTFHISEVLWPNHTDLVFYNELGYWNSRISVISIHDRFDLIVSKAVDWLTGEKTKCLHV